MHDEPRGAPDYLLDQNLSKSDQNFTFTKVHRLLDKKQFNRVFQNPDKLICSKLVLLAVKNGLDHPRLGLAISKKNAKHAVTRNWVKRVVRESFRLNQHLIGSLDIVILSRFGIVELDSSQLKELIDKQWAKLTRLCAS